MSDTPTPRTDAAETNWWSEDGLRSAFVVRADFARELEREIERLRAERDEARRIACTYISGTYSKNNVMINRVSAMAEAARRGWDCYKENKR